jgi:hypothetical protein
MYVCIFELQDIYSMDVKKEEHQECQKEHRYYVTEYEQKFDKMCKKIQVPKCYTKVREQCNYEDKKECKHTYKQQCTTEKQMQCTNSYDQVCKPTYDYQQSCKDVPKQSCQYVDVPKCINVPHEECYNRKVKKCHNLPPEQFCGHEYKTKCERIPVNVPVKKQKLQCTWPEYRQYHDDNYC